LFEHDLFGKPLHTFPDHALNRQNRVLQVLATTDTSDTAEGEADGGMLRLGDRKLLDRTRSLAATLAQFAADSEIRTSDSFDQRVEAIANTTPTSPFSWWRLVSFSFTHIMRFG
jgi:hypothetical protein